ncbi:LITAF-like zinc ribbon domain-containing protein [Crucibulum laeve]|uniref:LITAF-like zinc ribbon domain-containing protein n=1 Tax=Crucibulum laeve TaxID=68775 RepID=A0A5C3MUE6_9AGAR|nr:LITAF-like zinc ribbon domain-containing protein [Crucibulum laeve]
MQQQPPVTPSPNSKLSQQFHTATALGILGEGSAPVDCPVCRQRNMTQVTTEIGNTTHAWAAGFCIFLCLGCIPYLITATMNVRHNCGSCGALLATWHRSGRVVVHAH